MTPMRPLTGPAGPAPGPPVRSITRTPSQRSHRRSSPMPDVHPESGTAAGAVTALLDRTTPLDLAPLDLPDLARRGRRRRRRNRAAAGGAVVAVLAVLAAVVDRPSSHEETTKVDTALPG